VLDKSEWTKYLKQIAGQPELISAKLAAAGLSERELQKYIVLDVLPFRLEPVLDCLSGLRFDGLAAAEAEAEPAVNADGSAGSKVSGAGAAAETTGSPAESREPRAAVAVSPLTSAHPGSSDGSTLLIVLYQQDESQRAQYYALPI
jgi:anaerobic magnesium-protoporphyrin IX monomethyl ester cyclase